MPKECDPGWEIQTGRKDGHLEAIGNDNVAAAVRIERREFGGTDRVRHGCRLTDGWQRQKRRKREYGCQGVWAFELHGVPPLVLLFWQGKRPDTKPGLRPCPRDELNPVPGMG